jgi:formylglycine-generating enzyme required for sulfatase activity
VGTGEEDWGYGKYDPALTPDQDRNPVSWVRLDAAARYCEWLSSKLGRRCRLPTAEEWEKAARGVDGRAYPWGEKLHRRRARLDRVPVRLVDSGADSLDESPYGARHMCGNLAEITGSPYRGEGWISTVKGGSYQADSGSSRCASEGGLSNGSTHEEVGFRVLIELP